MGWGYSKMRDRPVAAVISAILHGVVYAIVWAVYYFACFSRGAHTRRWKRMIRRSLASGTLARPRGEYRIALHPEFALAGYGGTSSTFAWATTKSVNATGDEVFVEFADQVVLRIPFRAFETQTERLLFLGQLEELARAQGVQCPRLA